MALTNNDQIRIRKYLLGKLSEDEQQKIEERLIAEDDLFQELEISKSELVEDYRANELSRDEKQWFENHFLASPEGKEMYELTMSLDHLARSIPKRVAPATFSERLQKYFRQYRWAVATASAVVIVGLILILIYNLRPAGHTVSGPTLASNITNRAEGSLPAKVTIPGNASELKLRLLLPRDMSPDAKYRAELDNKTETRPVKVLEQDRESVSVVIPVSQLPRGEYSLKLIAITPEGTEREIPGDYLFNIQ
jgi:hypothetical protein